MDTKQRILKLWQLVYFYIKKFFKPGICVVFAIFFACLPIKMGNEANKQMPILGAIEQTSEEYTRAALVKVTAAYATSKLVNKTISIVQRAEISATPFGFGVAFAPGELLASAADAIDRVADALFVVLGVLLVQKLLIGVISFVCLKCFLPIGLVLLAFFYTCTISFPKAPYMDAAKTFGNFFVRTALILWLIFPVTAYINSFLERSFLDAEYSQVESSLEKDGEALDLDTGNIDIDALANVSETVEKVLTYIDNMIDNLFIMFSIFVMTNVIVPLAVYCFIVRLYKSMQQDILLQSYFKKLRDFQQPLQVALDNFESQRKQKCRDDSSEQSSQNGATTY